MNSAYCHIDCAILQSSYVIKVRDIHAKSCVNQTKCRAILYLNLQVHKKCWEVCI